MSSTEDLFRLVDEGGSKLDALLRQSNVDINAKDSAGRTTLSIAVERNKIETVKLLLRHNGLDVNAACNDGYNPIWYGAHGGYEDTVKLLLDRTDIVVNPGNGNTPLIAAAREGHVGVVKLLLKKSDIDVGMQDGKDGRTALHWAAKRGQCGVVEQLLARPDVDINSKDWLGYTPLSLVAGVGDGKADIAVVKALLSRKDVDVDNKSSWKYTALMQAAENGNVEVMKLLLETKKVDINCMNSFCDNALAKASLTGPPKVEAVQLLLQYGALRRVDGLDVYGILSNYLSSTDEKEEVQKILDAYTKVPDVLEPVELADLSYWTDYYNRELESYNQISWTTLGDHPTTEKDIVKTSIFHFASFPKDKLRQTEQDLIQRVLDHSKHKETKVEAPLASSFEQSSVHAADVKGELGASGPEFKGSTGQNAKWTWIHVPANNILWVKWAIQRLPTAYDMVRGTNLISIIDETFGEVKRSSNCRQVHCIKKDHVLSIVMPYLTTESKTYLEYRTKWSKNGGLRDSVFDRFELMRRTANFYSAEAGDIQQRGTMHFPLTLDQSYFKGIQPIEDDGTDQVIYRYTKDKEDYRLKDAKVVSLGEIILGPKILMVNQVWLWKIDDLVVTAFSEPWTPDTENALLQKLESFCIKQSGISPEEFVQHVLRQSINVSDEPVYRAMGEEETWSTIFAKSTSKCALAEASRYKEFSEYIRAVSAYAKHPKDATEPDKEFKFNALFDISPETDQLREVKDIRDELKMIGRVFDDQESVLLHWPGRDFENALDIIRKREGLKRLDGDAEDIEKRFNQLLDLKQKQGSLNFAADADTRAREDERQSQLLFAFTIITVIFTPLNFVAALYAIPTREYPHTGDNVNWKWWHTFIGMIITELLFVPTVYVWVRSKAFIGRNTAPSNTRTDKSAEPEAPTPISTPSSRSRSSLRSQEDEIV